MKIKSFCIYALSGLMLISLTGCVKKIKRTKIQKLSMGISKEAAIKKLGTPLETSTVMNNGRKTEILKYGLEPKESKGTRIAVHTLLSICTLGLWIPIAIIYETGNTDPYWLCFSNNMLTHYGDPVDLATTNVVTQKIEKKSFSIAGNK